MTRQNYINKIKEHILIILCFVALTFILTYPVITQVATHAAGDGGDGFQFKWNIWHVNKTLMEGGGVSDLFYTNYQFYPEGSSLAFHTLSLTNTLFIAFPLTLTTDNLILIYNILFFLTFILGGYGMYLLVNYLVKDKAVAFLAGFAYVFSPIHMAWGFGFLNLMSIQWIPFFFLFFFKMFEEKRISNSIFAAIFLFFLALASWQHLLIVIPIAATYFIYKLFTVPALFNKIFFLRLVAFFALFGIIILPFVIPMISEYLERGEKYVRPLHSSITPLSYILPSPLHSWWGERVEGFYFFHGKSSVAEIVAFPGYLVLLFAFLYLAKVKKTFFGLL